MVLDKWELTTPNGKRFRVYLRMSNSRETYVVEAYELFETKKRGQIATMRFRRYYRDEGKARKAFNRETGNKAAA